MLLLWLATGVLAAAPVEPPAETIVSKGAIDFDQQRRKERQRREEIAAVFEELDASPLQAAAQKVVQPFKREDSIDWASFIQRGKSIRQLRALLDELDDEQAILLLL